jgi:hypothetical protein
VSLTIVKQAIRLAELDGLISGVAPAAIGKEASLQHRPRYPRRMARLAR